jgi:hypothetical protein
MGKSAKVQCDYFRTPVELHYASLDSVETIPSAPGWYSWFYVPLSREDLSFGVVRQPWLSVTVDGPLGGGYTGRVTVPKGAEERLALTDEQFGAIRELMLAFAPPLYIGMARDLRKRLVTHRRHVHDVPVATYELNPGLSDTDAESAWFGSRISVLLADKIRRECLFVKCVVSTRGGPDFLKRPETVLNKLYTPPHGRRA